MFEHILSTTILSIPGEIAMPSSIQIIFLALQWHLYRFRFEQYSQRHIGSLLLKPAGLITTAFWFINQCALAVRYTIATTKSLTTTFPREHALCQAVNIKCANMCPIVQNLYHFTYKHFANCLSNIVWTISQFAYPIRQSKCQPFWQFA